MVFTNDGKGGFGLAYTLAAQQIVAWVGAAAAQQESGVRLRLPLHVLPLVASAPKL